MSLQLALKKEDEEEIYVESKFTTFRHHQNPQKFQDQLLPFEKKMHKHITNAHY